MATSASSMHRSARVCVPLPLRGFWPVIPMYASTASPSSSPIFSTRMQSSCSVLGFDSSSHLLMATMSPIMSHSVTASPNVEASRALPIPGPLSCFAWHHQGRGGNPGRRGQVAAFRLLALGPCHLVPLESETAAGNDNAVLPLGAQAIPPARVACRVDLVPHLAPGRGVLPVSAHNEILSAAAWLVRTGA